MARRVGVLRAKMEAFGPQVTLWTKNSPLVPIRLEVECVMVSFVLNWEQTS
jgi:hypothetical protein